MKCKYCNSKNILKHGKRKTKNRGLIQRYYCKDCKKMFSAGGKFTHKKRSKRWKIKKALELRKEGYSCEKIANQIGGVSRQTIWKWIKNNQ